MCFVCVKIISQQQDQFFCGCCCFVQWINKIKIVFKQTEQNCTNKKFEWEKKRKIGVNSMSLSWMNEWITANDNKIFMNYFFLVVVDFIIDECFCSNVESFNVAGKITMEKDAFDVIFFTFTSCDLRKIRVCCLCYLVQEVIVS